ncbi:MAG: SagB/ThcOx family dehydrogenase [Candidatus Hydrothermarchaeaceae archaeon]
MEAMKLPPPRYKGSISLEEAISGRRSVRRFSDTPVSIEDLSQILWAAQGITEGYFRTVPSAGALYPIELFVATKEGVHRYVPDGHLLEEGTKKDVRKKLSTAALGQGFIKDAPAALVITAVFERVENKYGERGARYVFLEAGHVAQNACLQAAALGLATIVIGAFYDSQVQEALEIPKDCAPVYIMPVGYKG